MTIIRSNGSKWAGSKPDNISKLLKVMRSHPLDRKFEKYGNFSYKINSRNCGTAKDWVGCNQIFGNFLTISHVFDIITDNKNLIRLLETEIRRNANRADYLSQDKPVTT